MNTDLNTLRRRLIRPDSEFTDEYLEQRWLAGSVSSPARCSKCGNYAKINNCCGHCGRDERAQYGDFANDPETWRTETHAYIVVYVRDGEQRLTERGIDEEVFYTSDIPTIWPSKAAASAFLVSARDFAESVLGWKCPFEVVSV